MSVAAASERIGARARTGRLAAPLAWLCGAVIVAATAEVVFDGAVEHTPQIPKQPAIAGWL